jgi:hypothetical protein
MLANINIPITITFYNTSGWDNLNSYVNSYFVDPNAVPPAPVKPSNWTYNFSPNPPP